MRPGKGGTDQSRQVVALVILLALMLAVGFGANTVRDQMIRRKHGVKPGVHLLTAKGRLVPVGRLLPAEVEDILNRLAPKDAIIPENAQLARRSGEIIPDKPGSVIDIQAAQAKIMAAEAGTTITPPRIELKPDLTQADIESIDQTLGFYQTYISGPAGKALNIQLAASACNYVLLMPGDIFSFNQVVGPTTLETGYHLAIEIVGGEFVPGYGGGVCQVASTIYNAVRAAQLEVIERYPHSRPVYYVPEGRDATVAYPYLDFKFMNNRHTPVIVRTWAGWSGVGVTIMGMKETDGED